MMPSLLCLCEDLAHGLFPCQQCLTCLDRMYVRLLALHSEKHNHMTLQRWQH